MTQAAERSEPAVAPTILEALVRQDRAILIGGLAAVAALAWAYVLLGAGTGMDAIEMLALPVPSPAAVLAPAPWSPGYAALMFLMWWAMMAAMMLPSASPAILLYAAVSRRQRERAAPHVPAGFFALGYLAAWGSFSAAATAVQWLLEQAGLLSAMMASTSMAVGGAILLAAGAWQLTPLKQVCLRHCRSPLHFLARGWRGGRLGALRMGIEHGAYCLGCCAFLMGLLFFGGLMNLYWIGGLALFVLIEKLAPAGHWIGIAVGVVLAGGGVYLIAGAL